MSFTFKTIKSTGRYRSFYPDEIQIKRNKKQVGNIDSSGLNNPPFKIRFMVIKKDIMEDKNQNCEWKWITLKKEFNSIEETKKFLNNNFEEINNNFKLYENI